MEQENQETEWRADVSEPKDVLKVADGEEVVFVFQDEGQKKTHPDYGTSIVFGVKSIGQDEVRVWYVNSQNFDLLNQLKTLGTLTNMKVKVSRTGSSKSNTRYTITKVD